jgi:flagellar motility protein MotE (MotC chaperone)
VAAEAPGTPRPAPPAQPAQPAQPVAPPATASAPVAPPPPPSAQPDPEQVAERALLGQLRARRAEIEARAREVEAREVVAAASERRLAARVEELARLVQQLEALERGRQEREETGWRGLVRLYEGMRPRDAAAIFDELEMAVLVEVVDRMREAKAAPVIGAMRPERARLLTTELARHRAERPAARAAD